MLVVWTSELRKS